VERDLLPIIRLDWALCPNVNYLLFMDLKAGLELAVIDSNSPVLT
jgi:hypothetical protein